MASKQKAIKAGKRASANAVKMAKKILEDDDVRRRMQETYKSSKHAYGRLRRGKKPVDVLLHDKKLKRDLKDAAESMRDAAVAMRKASKKRRHPIVRILVFSFVATALALIFSEALRKRVLDMLFGAEEEFEYTAPTAAAETNGAKPEEFSENAES
jgi:hypothetical protein